MQSIKKRVEEFSKNHSDRRNFLQNFIEKKEEEINKVKDDYEKGKIFHKAKETCEYDVANFKRSVLPGFKYKLELLENNDPDYKLLERSINFSDESTDNFIHQLDLQQKSEGLKIYRVVTNDKISTRSSDSDQILLLHGTKAQNVEGILKTGFIPSKKRYLWTWSVSY